MLFLAIGLAFSATAASTEAHQRGVDLYKQQKYAEAITSLQKALAQESPESLDYKESALLIGQSYFTLGRSVDAIPWLEKVTTENEANYMLGYAYLQNKQQDRAVAAFARLFGVPADSAAGHLVAAQMMIKQELEHYAAVEAQKAVALDPKLPEAHFLLGEVAIHAGRLEEGLAEMNKELSINPAFSMAWYRRGDVFTRQEKWNAAIPDLQRAVWLNQNFSGPYILLGKCYFKTGSYSNAEGMLRRALGLDPRNASATYLLGQTLMLAGKKDEGKQMLERWRSLKSEKPGSSSPPQP